MSNGNVSTAMLSIRLLLLYSDPRLHQSSHCLSAALQIRIKMSSTENINILPIRDEPTNEIGLFSCRQSPPSCAPSTSSSSWMPIVFSFSHWRVAAANCSQGDFAQTPLLFLALSLSPFSTVLHLTQLVVQTPFTAAAAAAALKNRTMWLLGVTQRVRYTKTRCVCCRASSSWRLLTRGGGPRIEEFFKCKMASSRTVYRV